MTTPAPGIIKRTLPLLDPCVLIVLSILIISTAVFSVPAFFIQPVIAIAIWRLIFKAIIEKIRLGRWNGRSALLHFCLIVAAAFIMPRHPTHIGLHSDMIAAARSLHSGDLFAKAVFPIIFLTFIRTSVPGARRIPTAILATLAAWVMMIAFFFHTIMDRETVIMDISQKSAATITIDTYLGYARTYFAGNWAIPVLILVLIHSIETYLRSLSNPSTGKQGNAKTDNP